MRRDERERRSRRHRSPWLRSRASALCRRNSFVLPLPVDEAFPFFEPEGERAWAQAWSKKDVDGYLSHYAKDFKTPGGEPRARDVIARVLSGFAGPIVIGFPKQILMLFNQEIIGSYGSNGMMKTAIRLLISQEVDIRPVMGPSVRLEDLPDAIADLAAGRALSGKVLVKPNL